MEIKEKEIKEKEIKENTEKEIKENTEKEINKNSLKQEIGTVKKEVLDKVLQNMGIPNKQKKKCKKMFEKINMDKLIEQELSNLQSSNSQQINSNKTEQHNSSNTAQIPLPPNLHDALHAKLEQLRMGRLSHSAKINKLNRNTPENNENKEKENKEKENKEDFVQTEEHTADPRKPNKKQDKQFIRNLLRNGGITEDIYLGALDKQNKGGQTEIEKHHCSLIIKYYEEQEQKEQEKDVTADD